FIPMPAPDKSIELYVKKDNVTCRNVRITDEKGVVRYTNIYGMVRFPVDEFIKDKMYPYMISLDNQTYEYEVAGSSLKNISYEEADQDLYKGQAYYKYVDFRTLKVTVRKDGVPISNADVKFDTTGAAVQKTNEEGIAEFFFLDSKMPTGITAEADGRVARKELEAHEILSGEILLDFDGENMENPLISGKISHSGSGISDVVLTAQKEGGNLLYAKTKVDGSYRFILPKGDEGEYTLKVIDTGGYDKGVLSETEKTAVLAGSQHNNFEFNDGIRLEGKITDTENKPLSGVKLYLEEETPSGQNNQSQVRYIETNENGDYQFAALHSGNYRMSYGLTNHIYSGSETLVLSQNTVKNIVMTGYSVTNPRNITYDITVKSPVQFGENGLVSVRCQNNDNQKYENLILEVNIPEGVIIEDSMLGTGQKYDEAEKKVTCQVNLGKKGDMNGTDSAVFKFMYRLKGDYDKDKVVFTAYAREETAVSDPLKEFEMTQFDWKRTEETKTIARKSSNPAWKWSELSGLTTGLTEYSKVWDGQNNRYFNMYASGSNIAKDYATWEHHSTKGTYDYRRFQSGFTRPSQSYNFSHILSENYKAYSGSGAVFPINDEIFMFVYPRGTQINNDNAGQYLAFWGSTQRSKYTANQFMGVEGNNAIWYKASGVIPAIQHSDYWVLDGSKNRVQEIMDTNKDAEEFVIDVFTCDFAQGGGMDKFNLVFTNSEIPSLDTGNTKMPYVDFIGLGSADLFRPTLTGDACVTVDFVKSNEYELRGESMKDSHVTIIGLDEEKVAADFDTAGTYSGIGTLLPPVPGTYAFVAECKKGDAIQYSNIHVVEVIEEGTQSPLQLTSASLDRTTDYGPKPFVSIHTLIGSHVSGLVNIATTFNEELKETDEVYYKLTGSNRSYEADSNLKTTVKLEDAKVKYVSVLVVRDGLIILNQVIGQIFVGLDPSGYVYDKHTGKRITGAIATCYVLNSQNEWEVWRAEDSGQINPQITDEEGRYAWDVPVGVYKVTVSKEGYEDYDTINDIKYAFEPGVESSIIIPPPRLDINIGMKNIEQPEIIESYPENGSNISPQDILRFEFNKSLDKESLEGNIRLEKDGQGIGFALGVNTTQNVITILPETAPEDGEYTLTFAEGIIDYVKEKNLTQTVISYTVSEQAEAQSMPFEPKAEELTVGIDSDILIPFNQKIAFGVKPDGGVNTYAVITSESGDKIDTELALSDDKMSLSVQPKEQLLPSAVYTLTLT
ncbi:MAG: Ig-like domain-containing protein, partial [Lachnoclostridium sp.]|nr:Ig-like domain-containing protein [Lachnoclostridium sp.]